MCRLVLYQGPTVAVADLFTRPEHSLIRQSYKSEEREEPLNGDGFGVAWYAPEYSERPALFRDVTPAWNNENLINLARVTYSGTILAHVRAATVGSVVQTNCHPFSFGRYAFMHNGSLKGFARVRRQLLSQLSNEAFSAIRGSTDSEHLFAVFLDRLAERDEGTPLERMAGALEATLVRAAELVAGSTETSFLNLVATDGENTVISRGVLGDERLALTLYLRQVNQGQRYRCEGGVCYIDDADAGEPAVLVASEPLFEHDDWTPIPANHLILIDKDRRVEQRPIAALNPAAPARRTAS